MEFNLRNTIDAPDFIQSITALNEDVSEWVAYRDLLFAEVLLTGSAQQSQPQIAHTLGCPASGKTTLLEYCAAQNVFPKHYFLLSFDAIMETFPQYKKDILEQGAQTAFEKWEIPARALGYEVLNFALNNRCNIVFENSGSRGDHVEMLRVVKEQLGYRVMIVDTQCDIDLAFMRAKTRARYLPPEYIVERRAAIAKLRPEFYLLGDEIRLYNTEHYPPVLLEHS